MKRIVRWLTTLLSCLISARAVEYQPWLTLGLKSQAVDEANWKKYHSGPVSEIDWSTINSQGWFVSVVGNQAWADPWHSYSLTLGKQKITQNWQLSAATEFQYLDGEPIGRINLKAFRSMYDENFLGNYEIGFLATRLEPLDERNLDNGNVYGVTLGKSKKLSLYYWLSGYLAVDYDEGTVSSDSGWYLEKGIELHRWFGHYRSIQTGLYYGRDETVLGFSFKQGL